MTDSPPPDAFADARAEALEAAADRARFDRTPLPDHLVDRLSRLAADEGAVLVPVSCGENRQLVGQLTREADRLQNGDPAYREELRYWTTRPAAAGDGVPTDVVPHADGGHRDEVPLRDVDTTGGTLPSDPSSGSTQAMLAIATATDVPYAWLRAGEAIERLVLELTRLGWAVSPVTHALEVPATRTRLRSALTDGAYPQSLLQVGHAAPTGSVARRRRDEVVKGSRVAGVVHARPEATSSGRSPPEPARLPRRPVSDGRGGTTWI